MIYLFINWNICFNMIFCVYYEKLFDFYFVIFCDVLFIYEID